MTASELGARFLAMCASAERELVLCAPFIKTGVMVRALEAIPGPTTIEVFTRWRPDEVAAGVCDTAILSLVEDRGGTVHLCDSLHAKYVRADTEAWVGSANLTAAALGWSATPNLELMLNVPATHPEAERLERDLRATSIMGTQQLADQVEAAAALLPRPNIEIPEDVAIADRGWIPALRDPFDLYNAYSQGPSRLSRASAKAAEGDLAALEVPAGLDREAFEALVATRLTQLSFVSRVNEFLIEPRRFGEVRRFLGDLLDLERGEAEHVWQTLMRWLLHFLPGQYARYVPSHTEMVRRRTPTESDK